MFVSNFVYEYIICLTFTLSSNPFVNSLRRKEREQKKAAGGAKKKTKKRKAAPKKAAPTKKKKPAKKKVESESEEEDEDLEIDDEEEAAPDTSGDVALAQSVAGKRVSARNLVKKGKQFKKQAALAKIREVR